MNSNRESELDFEEIITRDQYFARSQLMGRVSQVTPVSPCRQLKDS